MAKNDAKKIPVSVKLNARATAAKFIEHKLDEINERNEMLISLMDDRRAELCGPLMTAEKENEISNDWLMIDYQNELVENTEFIRILTDLLESI